MATRFPLHAAAQSGDVRKVSELLGLLEDTERTLKAEDEDDLGRTALYMAATNGHKDICEILLDCDPTVIYHKASGLYENNVLHIAVSSGLCDEEPQRQDDSPEHKLSGAKKESMKERKDSVVLLLLERQADVSARNAGGYTALHLAAGKGDVTAARWLVERGADIDSRAKNGHSPLFSAVCNAQHGMVAFLLNIGASAKAIDERGESLLHAAAVSRFTHHDSIKWLIEANADPQLRRKDGKTALMVAYETIVDCAINGLTTKVPTPAPLWVANFSFKFTS